MHNPCEKVFPFRCFSKNPPFLTPIKFEIQTLMIPTLHKALEIRIFIMWTGIPNNLYLVIRVPIEMCQNSDFFPEKVGPKIQVHQEMLPNYIHCAENSFFILGAVCLYQIASKVT